MHYMSHVVFSPFNLMSSNETQCIKLPSEVSEIDRIHMGIEAQLSRHFTDLRDEKKKFKVCHKHEGSIANMDEEALIRCKIVCVAELIKPLALNAPSQVWRNSGSIMLCFSREREADQT